MLKKCAKCGKELPLTTEYYSKYSSKNNNVEPGEQWHTKCKQCEYNEKYNENWKDGLLKCHCCGKYFPEETFHLNGCYNKTSNYRNNRDNRCPSCKSSQNKKRRTDYSDEEALRKILQMRLLGCKQRAKDKNIEFDLSQEFLKELWDKQNGLCALSKIAMTYKLDEGRIYTNVSVDKINPNLGYTKDNVQLVCMAVNQMKSDLRIEELYMFCEALLKHKQSI